MLATAALGVQLAPVRCNSGCALRVPQPIQYLWLLEPCDCRPNSLMLHDCLVVPLNPFSTYTLIGVHSEVLKADAGEEPV